MIFMMNMYYMLYFMFMFGLIIFCSKHKHMLMTLLSLEYLVLCIFLFFIFFFVDILGDYYIMLVFLTFSVCEGVLGLSILVTVIRSYGNDHINSIFMSKW